MTNETAGLLRSMRTSLIFINAVLFLSLAYMTYSSPAPQSTIFLVVMVAQAVGVGFVLKYISGALRKIEESQEQLSAEEKP